MFVEEFIIELIEELETQNEMLKVCLELLAQKSLAQK